MSEVSDDSKTTPSSSSKEDVQPSFDGIVGATGSLSLQSIPSIDRSDDEDLRNTEPGSSNDEKSLSALAHTPPPVLDEFPNLAHTPPPPPAPEGSRPPSSFCNDRMTPSGNRNFIDISTVDAYKALSGSNPATPSANILNDRNRSSLEAGNDTLAYGSIGRSPSSLSGVYGAIGGLYNNNAYPASIYGGSICGMYGTAPPVPPPPLSGLSHVESHQREHSMNSIHSAASMRDFSDKPSLDQIMSTSPKLSNRDMQLNRMSNIYGTYQSPGNYGGLTEMLTDPVEEEGGERVVWEYHNVQLSRVSGYGFGIAVSGGRDNPHFRNGDPSIAISDVLKGGPAEGKLEVNDRLISANGMSLENVDYTRAVQVLRECEPSVHLTVKRRIVLPSTPEPQTLKVSLNRSKKKEDYGVVLGCRIYVKEILSHSIAQKDGSLREGDILLRVNNSSTDNMGLKEARKLIDGSKERLQLVVRREFNQYLPSFSPDFNTKDSRSHEFSDTRPNYSTQNLYVQPPTRHPDNIPNPTFHDINAKSNLRRFPQHGPPIPPIGGGFNYDEPNSPTEEGIPPRPPLPRPEDYFSRTPNDPTSPGKTKAQPPGCEGSVEFFLFDRGEPRFVSFHKEGSVGIRLTGGNEVGIYVTAVQPQSQAQLQGLMPGDKILKVNDMDMTGVTREEAVLYLMSLQDQIDLIVQTRITDYQEILNSQKGDLFYIRTHFHYDPAGKTELSFRSGDIFRVVDTLHNGVVGAWLVHRMGRNNQETQKGIIPNKARAEEIATAQFNAAKKEQTQSESRSGFFKRRRNSRRSKSLGKDHWEDVVFADSVSKFPAYERVSLRHPGFVRPVVLFGPLSDIATDKLLKENPEKYSSPQLDSSGEKPSGIIRLSAIREILDRGKHAVLDITPNAVDRLNYAQFYPIVVFLRAESKQVVKELRTGYPKGRMSSKKLYDQSVKLEKLWSHVFTTTISLSQPDTWYRKMKDLIDKQQGSPIWMSEAKPSEALTDDFLFPMTSRLSYASSPESDLEGTDSRTPSKSPTRTSPSQSESRGRLVKSSSDPSIAPEEVPSQAGAPISTHTPSRTSTSMEPIDNRRKSQGTDSKYGFGNGTQPDTQRSIPPPKRDEKPNGESTPVSKPRPHPQSPPPSHHSSPPHNRAFGPPRSPLKSSYSNSPGYMYPPHDLSRNPDQPELPPKVDRTSKPGKPPKISHDPMPNSNHDANYMNTGRNSNVESHSKSPYEGSLGPNAHDDLKSRHHPRSPIDHYKYKSQPFYPPEDPYSRSDRPMPPPKSGNYKPVPPPKPKSYRGPDPDWTGYNKGFDRGYQGNGRLSDDYSGLDSGQGSSLDRKYDTFGRTPYSKQPMPPGPNRGGGYYLNVAPRDHPHNTGRDLPNHDHRGSAFELYKKPADPRMSNLPSQPTQFNNPPLHPGLLNQIPHYVDQGSR